MKRILSAIVFICLAGAATNQPASKELFDPRIEGSVIGVQPGIPVQIFVESDYSKGWQQFPEMTRANSDGAFQVRITQPGYYWLIAVEFSHEPQRRGACLIEVQQNGEALWLPLPKLRVSNKWGGNGTSVCRDRTIPLFTKLERANYRYNARK